MCGKFLLAIVTWLSWNNRGSCTWGIRHYSCTSNLAVPVSGGWSSGWDWLQGAKWDEVQLLPASSAQKDFPSCKDFLALGTSGEIRCLICWSPFFQRSRRKLWKSVPEEQRKVYIQMAAPAEEFVLKPAQAQLCDSSGGPICSPLWIPMIDPPLQNYRMPFS